MTSREKILLWMEAKNDLLVENGITIPVYFTDEDREELARWSGQECLTVWRDLRLAEGRRQYGALSCPWCVYRNIKFHIKDCSGCCYGMRHGICGDHDRPSDWLCIESKVKSLIPSGFFLDLYKTIEALP